MEKNRNRNIYIYLLWCKYLLTFDNEYVILRIKKGIKVFAIIFYKDKNGSSDIINYLDELQERLKTDKNARVKREKILVYLAALAEYGTRIGKPYVKHIDGNLWELRPLRDRIFFFYWREDQFVLVHHYLKRSQKTPKKEIEKARKNRKDFLERSARP